MEVNLIIAKCMSYRFRFLLFFEFTFPNLDYISSYISSHLNECLQ